jgi:Flp pilus assembly protein TadG
MGKGCSRAAARREGAGAAAVEFALVSGLLILLLFGIVDFGWMINRDTMINNASREGAREASLNPTVDDVRDTVMASLSTLSDMDENDITVTCRKPANAACNMSATDATAPASGDVAIVSVAYTHTWVTPVTPAFFGPDVVLTKTTEMRIE